MASLPKMGNDGFALLHDFELALEMNFASENFGLIWPRHVDGLILLMTRLRNAFDGDLDAVLILAVIGSATLPRKELPEGLSYRDFIGGSDRESFRTPLNAHSISEITGIPRETVRRKLMAMAGKGWVKRNSAGHWAICAKGSSDLAPMTDMSLEYLSDIADAIKVSQRTGKSAR